MQECRGKRIDNGKWVEGCLIIAKNFCCILQDEEKVHPMDYPYLDGELGCIDGYVTPIIPKTAGKNSGKKDKNGKKIFEGDIHKNIYNGLLFVACLGEYTDSNYELDGYGWYWKSISTGYISGFNGYEHQYVNIIGNVHDNPELLEGKGND